jgi:membrane associated rhomboid family serine protease
VGLPVDVDEIAGIYKGKPFITCVLISVNVVIYLALRICSVELGIPWSHIMATTGVYPVDVLNPEAFHRVLTAMFTHANLLHLLGNMFFLYIFGRDVEAVMGHWKYLIFYILSGIGADVFNTLCIAVLPKVVTTYSSFVDPWLVPAVGASGAISGVLGAYLVLFPHARVLSIFYFIPLLMSVKFYIGLWFAFQLILGVIAPSAGIAFWAHVGGFISGIALLPLFLREKDLEELRERVKIIKSSGL